MAARSATPLSPPLVYHTLRVPHTGGEQTDWAAVIDGWFQQAVLSHAPAHGYPPAQPTYGHGHHGHGDGGFGAGAMVAGLVAGEVLDEVFDDEGDED